MPHLQWGFGWGTHGPPRLVSAVGVLGAVLGVLALLRLGRQQGGATVVSARGATVVSARGASATDNDRIEQYCHPPVGRGSEGEAPPELELLAVAVVIRHGDRSQILPLPTEKSLKLECGRQEWWENVEQAVTVKATRSVSPEVDERTGSCLPGQLTQIGSNQLQALGRHLQNSYQHLLDRVQRQDVYVRSTNFTRTKASAASFISTLFEGKPALADGGRIAVDVVSGPPGSPGEPMLGSHQRCPAAAERSRVELAAWMRPDAAFDDVAKLFGASAASMQITDFADSANVATCHSRPQPCGDGGCISAELHSRLMAISDAYYCRRFGGSSGGHTAWSLSMYPFVSEVLSRLQAAADASQPSVAIFSGHDTVIAPVLAALNVYGVGDHWCGWPAYASRIAFELYHSVEKRPTETAATVASSEFYIRLVFNGDTLKGVRGCESSGEFCRLSDFRRGVESMLGGASDYKAACAATR